MRRFLAMLALMAPVLLLAGLAVADDKDKDKGGPVAALAPSPLDGAFEKAMNTKEIDEGLLNNDLYKKAVKAALKAKQDQQKRYADDPKLVGPTPAQAARVAFLEALRGEAKEDKPKDKDKDKEDKDKKDKH
jgi:uncharacterized protein YbcC (UPF0753/DUF2309 family)